MKDCLSVPGRLLMPVLLELPRGEDSRDGLKAGVTGHETGTCPEERG